jgi:hypothetical protein
VLSTNCTSILKPLDLGIIKCLKSCWGSTSYKSCATDGSRKGQWINKSMFCKEYTSQ